MCGSIRHTQSLHTVSSPLVRQSPLSTLFPYTTLFRSLFRGSCRHSAQVCAPHFRIALDLGRRPFRDQAAEVHDRNPIGRSEEHTSELQSHSDLVCRLLLEKKRTPGTSWRHSDANWQPL